MNVSHEIELLVEEIKRLGSKSKSFCSHEGRNPDTTSPRKHDTVKQTDAEHWF